MRRLMTLCEVVRYHGSSEANPVFGPTHTGHNSHTFGAYTSIRYGIFFSNNRKAAMLYGQVGRYRLTVRHGATSSEGYRNRLTKCHWLVVAA